MADLSRPVLRSLLPRVSALLGVAAWASAGVSAAERVVLCEEFTTHGCMGCAYAGQALSLLLDDYADSFALVQYHVTDTYGVPWSDARAEFYGVGVVPTAWFDGTLIELGGHQDIAFQYELYLDRYTARQESPTDISLDITGEAVNGAAFELTATACREPGGTGETPARVYCVQVLDYWPTSAGYYRNGFKQAADAQDITLAPGACATVVWNILFDDESWSRRGNIKIIAWVQQPEDGGPAEVLQAAIMAWPFPLPPRPGDLNCDRTVNAFDIDPFVLALANPPAYDAAFPECDRMRADCNADGRVDAFDVGPFVDALMTGPPDAPSGPP